MQINFVFGQTVSFDALAANSIALDGAVQGPAVDAANRRFSFDHHAGCTRLVTLATCQQVATALRLGLVVDEKTEVVVNDLDADTVMAVWLLKNPERIDEPRVKDLTERVGLTDSHGPIFPPHFMHSQLGPKWGSKDPQTIDMLGTFLAKVTDYADGKLEAPAKPEREAGKGFGWSPKSGWKELEVKDGFADVYGAGYLVGVLFTSAPNETLQYTVGKRSDLVPLAIGPASVKRPATCSDDYRRDTLLGQLALAELETNPSQSHAANWGGATTVGGSPRNADGSQSRLTPSQVLEICKWFTETR